jgi:pilus assembly protein CpaE
MTVLIDADAIRAQSFTFAIGGAVIVETPHEALRRLDEDPRELLVVVGPDLDQRMALDLAEQLQLNRPHIGVVLIRSRVDVVLLSQALRAGVREVVTPEDLASLGAACARSLELSRRRLGLAAPGSVPSQPQGRVITVFSAKGGCGKTTVATNLAATLARGGAGRVCLVDLDLAFGDVAIALQLMPAHTITDAVSMVGSMDEQAVASLVTPHSPGLDTLLAPVEPGESERIPVALVGELLRVLKRLYEYVVVDTPPAFTEHVLATFDATDSFVLLATLDIPSVKNLRLTLEMLDLLGYPHSDWLIALNRSDSKVGLSIAEVEQALKVPIRVQIPSSRDVSSSINRGVPLVLAEPQHAVSRAIGELARLTGDRPNGASPGAVAPLQSTRRGPLSVLRRGGGA